MQGGKTKVVIHENTFTIEELRYGVGTTLRKHVGLFDDLTIENRPGP